MSGGAPHRGFPGRTRRPTVAKISMVCGALLCVLGFVSYGMSTSLKRETALIPAIFGALLLLLGFFALIKPGLRKHLMHAAAAVGLLGFVGGLVMFLINIGPKGLVLSTVSQLMMAIMCGIFVAACIRSFKIARRERAAAAAGGGSGGGGAGGAGTTPNAG